jgi:hypothetical protein
MWRATGYLGPPDGSARTERYQKATLSLAAHFVLLPPLLLQIKTQTRAAGVRLDRSFQTNPLVVQEVEQFRYGLDA